MGKKYTKVEHLASVTEYKHNKGETYRKIATSMGLSREQVRELMKHEKRKQRKIAAGYIPQPKGRPRKSAQNEEERKKQRDRSVKDASSAAAKFSVRGWKEVKLKYRVIERFRGQYSIDAMCRFFEVSRNEYYTWRRKQQQPARDQWLVDMIVECQQQCKQTYGYRCIRRWLQRKKDSI